MKNLDSCGGMIKHLHDTLEKHANNTLRKKELTLMQVRTLITLNTLPGKSCSFKELEKQLNVAQSTAAGIAKRLEDKGLIESIVDPNDKRIKIARITPEGIACYRILHTSLLGEHQPFLYISYRYAENILFGIILSI